MDLEERRQQKLNTQQRKLEAKDAFRIAVQEREIERTARSASQGREVARREREKAEGESNRDMSTVDETTRLKMDADFKKMAEFLDIGVLDFEDNLRYMKEVMAWAEEVSGKRDILAVLSFIKKVRNDYGFKEVGVTGLKKLYTYARLDMNERRIKEEKKLLKDG